jgi:DNA repair exonuclease SbcCD nuclease subunit
MKLLHSADWQLGCRFNHFGDKADLLRQTRFKTLRRALEEARRLRVDAFIVAGDLFDDNEVQESVVTTALATFADYPDVPVFILPGNHDPFIGPSSVWNRKSFLGAPKNVRVFRQAEYLEVNGGFLLASPLHQKQSTLDPSLKLDELARKLPRESLHIGITHGSLAIPSQHQPNDFPISLQAATRAGLDYLGVGHWHNWQVHDDGRLVMPGTPEQDSFEHSGGGFVAHVTLDEKGAPPQVQQVRVGTMHWQDFDFNFLDVESARTLLQAAVAELRGEPDSAVVRVRMQGSATREVLPPTRQWLTELLKPFPFSQLHDETSLALTPAELEHLKANHPILSQVLADLDQIAAFTVGVRNENAGADPLAPAQVDKLLSDARIDRTKLTAAHFERARQLLLQRFQEVA